MHPDIQHFWDLIAPAIRDVLMYVQVGSVLLGTALGLLLRWVWDHAREPRDAD